MFLLVAEPPTVGCWPLGLYGLGRPPPPCALRPFVCVPFIPSWPGAVFHLWPCLSVSDTGPPPSWRVPHRRPGVWAGTPFCGSTCRSCCRPWDGAACTPSSGCRTRCTRCGPIRRCVCGRWDGASDSRSLSFGAKAAGDYSPGVLQSCFGRNTD